jgi:integrase
MKGLTLRGRIWWISYNANGRRIRESVGPSKSLAKEVLAKRKNEISEGRFFDTRKTRGVTFRAIADKYWELHGQHLRSTAWRYMLTEVVGRFGDKPAGDISIADLQAYYNEIRARASVSTANRNLTLLKSVFNRAIAWELYSGANPAAKITKGKEPPNRLRYLSEGEIRALLSACDTRIFPLLACALYTGMRRGELLALTWANVDLAQGLIYILQSKSGKPREIPIAPNLSDILAGIGRQEPASKVFDLPIITLRRHFELALRAAGIAGFHFHDLRHTFASHFVMKTGNLPDLQKILGHASPMMTQRYAHLSSGYLQAEMLAFNACIPARTEINQEIKTIGHNLGTIAIQSAP